jgi:hypothetical protein
MRTKRRGTSPAEAKRLLLELPGVAEGRSYGFPAFLLKGHFLARFRDDDTVLVLKLASIPDREFLMQMNPQAFFFTEHYRNYPAVLVRLAEISRTLLARVVKDSCHHLDTMPLARLRPRPRKGRAR